MSTMNYGAWIRVQGLRKRFGRNEVLRGLDLEIEPGQFLAIVGRSGCGKSTLLRLLSGLDTPDDGWIEINGKPLSGRNPAARVMFQDARLLPWKRVLDNVALGRRDAPLEEARAMLRHVGLAGRERDWPAQLSGGQKQRVALARALLSHPSMLLLDEPLGALDALTRIEMQGLVESLWWRGRFTAIMVTHDVEEAVALADRVVLLEHGRVALDEWVDLDRPRKRGDQRFGLIKERLLSRVMQGGAQPLPAHAEPPLPVEQVAVSLGSS